MNQFLSGFSHDIRTYLHVILSTNEQLLKTPKIINDQNLLSKVEMSYQNSENLLKLVNNLLDLAKLENKKVEINNERFSIADLIKNYHQVMNSLLKDKKVKFEIILQNIKEQEAIVLDKTRLSKCLLNLLDNAAKFTKKGRIVLTIHSEDKDRLYFKVSDTGQGIKQEDFCHIFEPYMELGQNSSIKNQLSQGTGLGLALCKKNIELMGGHISLQSIYEKETEFTFWLPLVKKKLTPSVVEKISLSAKIVLKNIKEKRILVCDDDEFNRALMEMILSAKMRLNVVNSGRQAVLKAEKHKYDLIFMDLKLPALNGFQALKMIRKTALNKTTPVVALTAFALNKEIEEIKKAEFNYYLTKPFREEELLRLIMEIV